MRPVPAGLLAGIALLLGSCAALPPEPPPPRNSTLDFALLAGIGDVPRTKVTTVNGRPIESVTVRPVDAPAGMSSSAGVWLPPGRHVVHAQYVRNIEAGIAFAQGDLVVHLVAGHTYMIHPIVGSDYEQVRFSIVDYGTAFPATCLPWSIGAAKDPTGRSKSVKFTREEILACAGWGVAEG